MTESTIDLKTRYLGLGLDSPLVVSACPLCEDLDNIKRMEDAGAAAVVLHSLFEEQFDVESQDLETYMSQGAESYAEALSYFPEPGAFSTGPEAYLEHLSAAKAAVGIPVIGSLNGVTTGGWTHYAERIEEAGADGLELNLYFLPSDPETSGAQVEESYLALVREVAGAVGIPVAVKLSPFFSAPIHMLKRLEEVGAKGAVLFNRFYQPDVDLDELEWTPSLELSQSRELRLRLRWISLAFGRVGLDLAVTGGVHTPTDVIKAVMSGANVTMTTSALLANGIGHLGVLKRGVLEWMEEHEYESIEQMHGSMSQHRAAEPAALERANYMKVLRGYASRV